MIPDIFTDIMIGVCIVFMGVMVIDWISGAVSKYSYRKRTDRLKKNWLEYKYKGGGYGKL